MYVKLIYGQHRHFTVHITKTLKKIFFQYSKAIVLHDKIPFVMLNHEQNPVYLCCVTLSYLDLGLAWCHEALISALGKRRQRQENL